MRWWSHTAIAGSIAIITIPMTVPTALLGATAPDWLEWVLKAGGIHVKHRTKTHVFSTWLIVTIILSLMTKYTWGILGLSFAIGGLTHVLTDAMTITGVPMTPWSDRRFYLFGGRLRTGQPGEYLIAAAFMLVAFTISPYINKSSNGGFLPWFPNYPKLYEKGVVDPFEWRINRFTFF